MYTHLLNSSVYCTSFPLPHDWHRLNIRACNDLLNWTDLPYKKFLSPYNISVHRFIELDQNHSIFGCQIRNFENFLMLDSSSLTKARFYQWSNALIRVFTWILSLQPKSHLFCNIFPQLLKFTQNFQFRVTIYCTTQFIEWDFLSSPSSINRRTTLILLLLLFCFLLYSFSHAFPKRSSFSTSNHYLTKSSCLILEHSMQTRFQVLLTRFLVALSLYIYISFIPILIKNSFLYLKF